MLQDILESNLEKRAKNLFVPMNGKKMIAFIDDMNMPTKVKIREGNSRDHSPKVLQSPLKILEYTEYTQNLQENRA